MCVFSLFHIRFKNRVLFEFKLKNGINDYQEVGKNLNSIISDKDNDFNAQNLKIYFEVNFDYFNQKIGFQAPNWFLK